MSGNKHILENIDTLSKENGFADWSYARAINMQDYKENFIDLLNKNMFADLDYLKRNIDKRFNPTLLAEGCKSIIVFLVPYGQNNRIDKNQSLLIGEQVEHNYKVAQYALGEDYHITIKEKLYSILAHLQTINSNIKGRVFTDTAPIYERGWAVESGLGFIGKNNFFISKQFGIRNFIGIITLNIEFDEYPLNKYKDYSCGNCTKCIDACPTNALEAPYTLNANKCISYITIEKKGANIASNIENHIAHNNYIFGCDVCMNACPWNSKNTNGWRDFEPMKEVINISHFKRR